MYNLGPTQFPMTRAYVYTVLPSLSSSAKLSSTNDVIGTFLQDRATAIAGRLGAGPSLLPVTLTLDSPRGGRRANRRAHGARPRPFVRCPDQRAR